ncbi:hypothetical protein PP178_05175 [Zeaxanthinibacter sp. PT1]|uniref:hypothetical protein n=1 Tax=Zeaxanthinibacter TaxID=561554 RepID=UPI00234B7CC6|nr:hypothetical protein [Zeaxanthinibacter sp. PT1]MDC6350934.1 hypothetical protein [Zeaxanthinibacter sp. PT1]
MKKVLGILLLIFSLVLMLAFLGQFSVFLSDLTNLFGLSEQSEAYDTGYLLGRIVYWVMHLSVLALLLFFGIRLLRKNRLKKHGL